ncbi:MAG: hypothetical protein IH800_08325, partial [Myxococcales bacterium]|nr:hypothetical protein [Myxococcales bacterium]
MKSSGSWLVVLITLAGLGCAPGRVADLKDSGRIGIGLGFGLSLDARLGDLTHPALGLLSVSAMLGFESRDIDGPWESLVWRLRTDLNKGTIKIGGLPRIDNVVLHVDIKEDLGKLNGTATMGGEPLTIESTFACQNGDLATGKVDVAIK